MIGILKMWPNPKETSTTAKMGLMVSVTGIVLMLMMKGSSTSSVNPENSALLALGVLFLIVGSLMSETLLYLWLSSWVAITMLLLFVQERSITQTIWCKLSLVSLILFLFTGIVGSHSRGGCSLNAETGEDILYEDEE